MVLYRAQGVAEALEVYDFAGTQELDWLAYIGVVDQAQQVVVGGAGFLLGGKVLKQIGDRIALALQRGSRERDAGRRLRIDTGGVVDKVGVKAAFLDLLGRQVARQLIDDRSNHFLMGKFLRAYKRIGNAPFENKQKHGLPAPATRVIFSVVDFNRKSIKF